MTEAPFYIGRLFHFVNSPHCRNLSSKSVFKNIQVGSLDIVKLHDGRMVEAKVTAIR